MRGKLIVFEGLDGAGITTQATLLRNYFLTKKRTVVLTKEPTEGLLGGIIKSCLRGEWKTDATTLQTLFSADRSHHLNTEINPAVKQGKIVICDRYVLSSIVYGSLNAPLELLKSLNERFAKPDLQIFVDTQPSICIQRMRQARHHVELFEEEQKLVQIRKNYLAMRNFFPNTRIVDGNRSAEDVMREIQTLVTDY
ncbi:MAG: dTMP kinase [Candidatus Aenigmarchaeota archaeon]|nr:dTMP kinase [Candidatus Aenigmarchaeota archaeon]